MKKHLSVLAVVLISQTLLWAEANAAEYAPGDAVTFFSIVDPNSFETSFTATIGEAQVTPEQLAEAIRPGSGRLLRITSVHGSLFGSPQQPLAGSYALAFIGACTPRFSVRGFGNGYMAFGGLDTVRAAYRPGLVASLQKNEVLCFRSLLQSNQPVLMEVHGFLMKRD